jgi:hypothetical protein
LNCFLQSIFKVRHNGTFEREPWTSCIKSKRVMLINY